MLPTSYKKEHDFEFKNCKERVDVFLYGHSNDKKEFQPLWSVFKLLLTISQPVNGRKTIQHSN